MMKLTGHIYITTGQHGHSNHNNYKNNHTALNFFNILFRITSWMVQGYCRVHTDKNKIALGHLQILSDQMNQCPLKFLCISKIRPSLNLLLPSSPVITLAKLSQSTIFDCIIFSRRNSNLIKSIRDTTNVSKNMIH